MKYKAILLDFYGTCVAEDDAIIERIISKISLHASAPPGEILRAWKFNEACVNAFGTAFRTQKEIEVTTLQAVLDQFGVDMNVEELSTELFDYWARPAVYPDTNDFLQRQNLPVTLVSNIDNVFLKTALADIDYKFSNVITSEDARCYKPRPEIFQTALTKNNLSAGEVIHIGDSYSLDVMGAHNCGIDVVWVNRKNKIKPAGLMKFQVSTLSDIRSFD